MSKRLFVGNVDPAVSKRDLEQHFASIGAVNSVTIPVDRESGLPRGFAFVEFRNQEHAERALEILDGCQFAGRRIRLGWAHKDRGRPRSAGGERSTRNLEASRESSEGREERHESSWEEADYASRHRDRPGKGGRHGSDRKRSRGTRRVIE